MPLLKNCWYVAAHSHEIEDANLARELLGVPVLLYRTEAGRPVAMSNICPHRFAPLDRGLRFGDTIECPYHGLRFDEGGTCVLNPHTDRLDKKMDLRAYSVAERHGFVWIWMGDEDADPALIPDLSDFDDAEGVSVCRSYIDADYRYDILIDNLLDLSHADYLHKGSFSSGPAEETKLDVIDGPLDTVVIKRLQLNFDAPPMFGDISGKIDMLMQISWSPSQTVAFKAGFVPAGTSLQSFNVPSFYHIATPRNAEKTHYFMGMIRYGAPDEEADRITAERQRGVIAREDGPMLEFVSKYMNGAELMDLHPLVLPVDAGALRVRRVMKRLLEREREQLGMA